MNILHNALIFKETLFNFVITSDKTEKLPQKNDAIDAHRLSQTKFFNYAEIFQIESFLNIKQTQLNIYDI